MILLDVSFTLIARRKDMAIEIRISGLIFGI